MLLVKMITLNRSKSILNIVRRDCIQVVIIIVQSDDMSAVLTRITPFTVMSDTQILCEYYTTLIEMNRTRVMLRNS